MSGLKNIKWARLYKYSSTRLIKNINRRVFLFEIKQIGFVCYELFDFKLFSTIYNFKTSTGFLKRHHCISPSPARTPYRSARTPT